jgi:hypothetical protein
MISREVKPREPRIKGVPSKMAVFHGGSSGPALYVGGTSLHRYAKASGGTVGVWDEIAIPQPPGGGIVDLAATKKFLYALTNADSPALYRWDGDTATPTTWENIPLNDVNFSNFRLQAIYGEIDGKGGVSDYLFVGAGRINVSANDTKDYAVFYIGDNNGALTLLKPDTALLTGAVQDNGGGHYFSTSGDGIYWFASPSPTSTPVNITGEKNVKGIIQIDDPATVLAFCYGGEILKLTASGSITLNPSGSGQYLRGPAAVWESNAGNLLLVTVISPDSTYGYSYGYHEINIDSGPVKTSTPGEIGLREPGNPITGFPSTMEDNKHYRDSIAAKPVNSIIQVPSNIDTERPLFASIQGTGTMKDDTDGGLWSYRFRDGSMQWNAE